MNKTEVLFISAYSEDELNSKVKDKIFELQEQYYKIDSINTSIGTINDKLYFLSTIIYKKEILKENL